jgi:hypothetical protein
VTDRPLVDAIAEAIWPWVRCGMAGVERRAWKEIPPGSLAHEITTDAALAAIAVVADSSPPLSAERVSELMRQIGRRP